LIHLPEETIRKKIKFFERHGIKWKKAPSLFTLSEKNMLDKLYLFEKLNIKEKVSKMYPFLFGYARHRIAELIDAEEVMKRKIPLSQIIAYFRYKKPIEILEEYRRRLAKEKLKEIIPE